MISIAQGGVSRRQYAFLPAVLSLSLTTLLVVTGCIRPEPTSTTAVNPANQDAVTNVTAESVVDDGMTDATLGMALLTGSDVSDVLDNVRPSTIELNDHLEKEYLQNYLFYVGRRWYERTNGVEIVYNAITKYPSAEVAQQETERLVTNYPLVETTPVGDTTFVAYDDPLLYFGGPSDPAHLIYRFTYGSYSVKVEVVDMGDPGDENSDIKTRLLKIAQPLAEREYEKLVDLLNAQTTEVPTNAALQRVPTDVSGLSLIGTVPVTAEEWLGATYDLTSDTVVGMTTGGMGRFIIDAQPDHVAEITVLEFATAEQAKTFQAELLTKGLAAETGTEIELPDSIAEVADAVEQETLAELQTVVDNYVFDVTVFAPFTEVDLDFSREELKTLGTQLFSATAVQPATAL